MYSKTLVLAALILLLIVATAFAEQIGIEYSFDTPSISKVIIDSRTYHRIEMEGNPNGGQVGEPALPYRGGQILIPEGAEVSSVSVTASERISLGGDFAVEPVGMPVRLSSDPPPDYQLTPNPAIYGSDKPFPDKRYETIGTHSFRGYSILIVRISPIEYCPISGKLYFYPRLSLLINTVKSDNRSILARGIVDDGIEVRNRVDNPDIAGSYAGSYSREESNYDLLIITVPSLAASFQPLKEFHDTTGVLTEIHTTDQIGSNDPDDVREYITERYLADGISYVLIGGDDDLIPAKDLYVESYAGNVEYAMPSDLYFACLDGPYDFDGDVWSGEPTDGEGGSDVDLIAEVYVGRAAVGNSIEVDRFTSKTIEYLTSDNSNLNNVLMVGEHLGFGGLGEYGGYSMDEIVDGAETHGYVTVGIPSDDYNLDKLYDVTWPSMNWPSSEIVTRMNAGQHIINHLGHCNISWALKLSSYDVTSLLTNDDPFFLYSQGCLAGHFDGVDCWAENICVKTDYGAFAVIMNARFGFGAFYSTDGASQRFNREFWDAVYNPSEGKPELGRANHDSKEDNLYRINEGCMRWVYYETNLFGDPTAAIRNLTSLAFEFPDGLPSIITPEEETTVDVEIVSIGDGVHVEGTGQLHYSINDQVYQTVPMAITGLNTYRATLPVISCLDHLDLMFSAEESTLGRIYHTDQTNPHTIRAGINAVMAFEDNFETDKGWTVSGGLWARGIPTGNGGNSYSSPDPTSGCAGPNVFGYNLDGNYEDNLSRMNLTSPSIDCSGLTGTHLTFWRWLGVEPPPFDQASISISTDGVTWTSLWVNTSEAFDVGWNEIVIDISEFADNQPVMFLRWTMGPTDGALTYCGWNLDHVRVIGHTCLASGYSCGDSDGSGLVDIDDVVFLIQYIFAGGPVPAPLESGDADCSGSIDVDDVVYLIQYIFSGGNAPCDPDDDGVPDC